MKTAMLALAATLISTSAFAALPGDKDGLSQINTGHVFTDEVLDGGNYFIERYTLNEDGSRNVIQRTFRNSGDS